MQVSLKSKVNGENPVLKITTTYTGMERSSNRLSRKMVFCQRDPPSYGPLTYKTSQIWNCSVYSYLPSLSAFHSSYSSHTWTDSIFSNRGIHMECSKSASFKVSYHFLWALIQTQKLELLEYMLVHFIKFSTDSRSWRFIILPSCFNKSSPECRVKIFKGIWS